MPGRSIWCWEEAPAVSKDKTVQVYLDTVAAQIRWKRARAMVTWELARHLEDQRSAFAAAGYANAEQLAVEEMGDPVSVGVELDCIHRPKPQWGLLALTILLALTGVLLRIGMTASWGPYDMEAEPSKALFAFGLGCAALLAGYFLDYARLGRHGRGIYLAALAVGLTALAVSPRVNGCAYYARCVTLYYPVIYAFWLYSCRRRGRAGLVLAVLGGIPLAAVCILAPYAFGLFLLLLTGFVLLIIAAWHDWFGIGRRKSVGSIVLGAAALSAAVLLYAYRSDFISRRLACALHPELDPSGAGYQASAIRKALGASQWLGEGTWSASLPFEQSVPGCDSDAFLTTLIYKLGWLPFLCVVLAFTALTAWLLHRCLKQKSQLGKMAALAVVMTLGIQALCSLAWNLGFPLSSASFPLIMGNLSTVLNMGLIGLALSVFRGERLPWEPAYEGTRLLPRYRIRITLQKV